MWGWDGSGAHVLQPDDGRTEVCGTFQMQICHERTLEEGKDERGEEEVIGFANATGQC